jgi:hypothetical protein
MPAPADRSERWVTRRETPWASPNAFGASDDFERDLLSLVEAVHSGAFDCADMRDDILAAIVRPNEAEAFLAIEPFHGSTSPKFEKTVLTLNTSTPVRPTG